MLSDLSPPCPVCGIPGHQSPELSAAAALGCWGDPFYCIPQKPPARAQGWRCSNTIPAVPGLSQPRDTFLCQLGKPAAPGLAQLSSSLLQTRLSAQPGWCDYRGEIRTGSVCVTSQGQLQYLCLVWTPNPPRRSQSSSAQLQPRWV